jgi:hypothetical protein
LKGTVVVVVAVLDDVVDDDDDDDVACRAFTARRPAARSCPAPPLHAASVTATANPIAVRTALN